MEVAQPDEQFGVGIYFAEDVDGERCSDDITCNECLSGQIFVESLVPEGSAAMTRTIQEQDVLVKINNQPTLRMGLAKLRSLVLGQQGSHVTMTFRREGTNGKLFYEAREDLGILDLTGTAGGPGEGISWVCQAADAMSCNCDGERQIKIEGLVAEKEELIRRSRERLNQDEVQKLEKENLKNKEEAEKFAQLLETWKEKAFKLEKMLTISQNNMKSREEHVNRIEELDRDRLGEEFWDFFGLDKVGIAYVSELERRFQEEKQIQRTVQAKLQASTLFLGNAVSKDGIGRLEEGIACEIYCRKEFNEGAFSAAGDEAGRAPPLSEPRVTLSAGADNPQDARRQREDEIGDWTSRVEEGSQVTPAQVGLELATLMGKMEDSHDYVIHEVLRSARAERSG
eukprot:762994-Hanusia_phi.AAC.8